MKKTGLPSYRQKFIKLMSVFMVVFPWITYLNLSRLSETEQTVFVGYNGMLIDFFIHNKGVVLILAMIVSVLYFVGERVLPRKVDNNVPLIKGQNKWLFVLSGIFAAGTLLSTFFSKYQENAFSGSPTEGEGLWVLLCYVLVIFTFYNSFANEYGFNMAKKTISVLSGITIALTLVEWFYKPLLEIGLIQSLVAPAQYADLVASMEAGRFSSSISLTFYNPGYLGGFICLLLPFVLGFFLQAKNIKERVLHAILTVGLLFGVMTVNTTTALYIAMLEVFLVVGLHMLSQIGSDEKGEVIKACLPSVAVVGISMVTILVAGVITGNSFFGVFSNENSATGNIVEDRFEIEDILLEGNCITLVGETESIVITMNEAGPSFCDGTGQEIESDFDGENFTLNGEAFENVSVALQSPSAPMQDVSVYILVDAGYQATIDFLVRMDGTVAGVGQNGMPINDIGDAGTPEGLKSFYGMFTGRGYAWVNSLPIVKDTWLIGKGPGNFAYYFKQFDYVGLLDTHERTKQIIDKPHNAYLQYAINLGWPAAIAFFGIFVGALVKATRLLIKDRKYAMENPIYVGALVAAFGFLIYSLINDSIVTVTPVACMIVGLLLASCYEK